MRAHPIILGTAGHIDHGKTALVRALTGIDTDRLKEEKERGITIELGFAHLDLEGRRLGLVDVPGHERFLRAMVAGAHGVDVVIFVVAADEGVMPQTREHLDICDLLGVRRGVIALTKRDLVSDEWLELVAADVRKTVARSFLAGAALVPVSSTTGAGLDELRRELARLADAAPPRPADGPFRMPIDRAFSLKGFGTVVTGTVQGGRLRPGDEVVLLPSGRTAKTRGLEGHGESLAEAVAGLRCAVNLGGLEREAAGRGEILAHPGVVEPSHLLDARLRYLVSSREPLGRRAAVLLHHGTAQLGATVVLVDRESLPPGEEALVQLHLERPIAALPGDRFILRGFVPQQNHGTTIGGGAVLRVHAPKVRRASADAAATLERLAAAAPDERVALEVRAAGPAGLARATLAGRLGVSVEAAAAAAQRLVAAGELLEAGGELLHAEPLARLEATALAAVDAFHAERPLEAGLAKEELRSRLSRSLPPRLFEALLAGLVRRGAVVVDRDVVHRPRRAAAPAAVDPIPGRVLAALDAAALETPRPQDLPALLKLPEKDVRSALDALVRKGDLVRVRPDYLVAARPLGALRERLRAHLAEKGQITTEEWKAMTGLSRKYAIPLAEHFDAEKITLRVGEIRKRRG